MKTTILMTACVCPNTNGNYFVGDPSTRKTQYQKALDYYISKTDFDIVFCENSGTDIRDGMPKYDTDRLEYLTYKSMPTIPDRGKGYKEMEIIEYAFNHSAKLGKSDIVLKATGRLMLKNVSSLADFYSANRGGGNCRCLGSSEGICIR